MYKKLNYKALIGVLLVLAVVFLIVELSGPKNHSDSYPTVLTEIDTAKITELNIAYADKDDINLVKEDGVWYIIIDGEKLSTERRVVDMMLTPMIKMVPQKVSATSKLAWKSFDLTDDKAIHVWVKEGRKEVANFYVGNFTFTQPTEQEIQANPMLKNQPGLMTTYIRLDGRDEVFGVNDFLNLTYNNKEPKHFRNKEIALLDVNEVRTVTFNYPGQNFNLIRKDTKWWLNNTPVDSATADQYVRILCNQKGVEFVDDFDISGKQPEYKVIIEGNDFANVMINAYEADTVNQYVVTSSLNPDAQFSGSRSDVFKKIFVPKEHFLPKEE